MKIYEGELKLIGEGIVQSNGGTKVSVLEIGNHQLRNIILTNYISTYLRQSLGQNVKILVSAGLSRGKITRPAIVAFKINEKIYKEESKNVFLVNFTKAICYCSLAALLYFLANQVAIPIIIAITAVGYYLKEYFDFMKF